MARIFSINFMHEGVAHNAMISVRTTPFFTEYTINMLDESIAEQLPNNKIISTSKDSFVFSDSTSENSPALMEEIVQAVSSHMQTLHA
jgi:hypothetical protein